MNAYRQVHRWFWSLSALFESIVATTSGSKQHYLQAPFPYLQGTILSTSDFCHHHQAHGGYSKSSLLYKGWNFWAWKMFVWPWINSKFSKWMRIDWVVVQYAAENWVWMPHCHGARGKWNLKKPTCEQSELRTESWLLDCFSGLGSTWNSQNSKTDTNWLHDDKVWVPVNQYTYKVLVKWYYILSTFLYCKL